MYATIEHRKVNLDRVQETVQQGASDFFPKLEHAPGFLGFYVVAQENGSNAAIALWENRAQAEDFRAEAASWLQTLEEHGHRLESDHGGEVIAHITPPRTAVK